MYIPQEIRDDFVKRVRAGEVPEPQGLKEIADHLRTYCPVLIVWEERPV
jgi:hypothetical protein